MDHKPCLECGGEVSPCPEFDGDVVWCEGCPGYKSDYTATRAAIVSRVLDEAVKGAVIIDVPAGAVWAGSRDVAPGIYALIPVKEDKS